MIEYRWLKNKLYCRGDHWSSALSFRKRKDLYLSFSRRSGEGGPLAVDEGCYPGMSCLVVKLYLK